MLSIDTPMSGRDQVPAPPRPRSPRFARIAADVDEVGPAGVQSVGFGQHDRPAKPTGVVDLGQNFDVVSAIALAVAPSGQKFWQPAQIVRAAPDRHTRRLLHLSARPGSSRAAQRVGVPAGTWSRGAIQSVVISAATVIGNTSIVKPKPNDSRASFSNSARKANSASRPVTKWICSRDMH